MTTTIVFEIQLVTIYPCYICFYTAYIYFLTENIPHRYTEVGNIIGDSVPGDRSRGEIIADLSSTFTVLLAIYFPSVTG